VGEILSARFGNVGQTHFTIRLRARDVGLTFTPFRCHEPEQNQSGGIFSMSRFSATLMDHFQDPRHLGRMENPDAVGVAGTPGRGLFLVLYLRVADGSVAMAQFECHGCGVTIACGSILTELVEGRSLGECWELKPADIAAALEGLPPDKGNRADFAVSALRDGLTKIGRSPASISA
jgi:NifU-like protein involved in Fe-S cluster formation